VEDTRGQGHGERRPQSESQSGKDPGVLTSQELPSGDSVPQHRAAHVLNQFTEHLSPGFQGEEASKDRDSLVLE
jgi:hypothetical protein